MKKVLFATTALIATAGMAAADVTFGGYGRFGLNYNTAAGADLLLDTADDTNSTDVTYRYRLQIDASAESDAGVTFGARVRIQQNTGGTGTGINSARFFARTGGLEVGVGNIFGALEFMPGMYPIDLGLTGLGYDYTAYNFQGDAYSSGGTGAAAANGVEVMYSAGDLSLHISASDTNSRVAAHAAYTFSGWTVALGVQDSTAATDTELAFSVGGTIGIADVTLAYADNGTSGDQFVLAGRFDVGAATNVEVYYADRSGDTSDRNAAAAGVQSYNGDSYGIDVNHDMGGGTSIRGGVAKQFTGITRADLGVRFNF
ncbi:MAG: outer membrane protein OmpU [Ascidiaceihabitans sp.]|jgi:outer membrane protein OmpU